MDADGNGRLDMGEWGAALRDAGFHGNTVKLFKDIDLDGEGTIGLNEFDMEAYRFWEEREEGRRAAREQKAKEVEKMMAFRASMDVSTRGEIKREIKNGEQFKEFLVQCFGGKFNFDRPKSLAYAWKIFDKSGDGSVTLAEFAEALRTTGFQGSTTKIFREFDSRKRNVIKIRDFDEAAADVFEEEQAVQEARRAAEDAAFKRKQDAQQTMDGSQRVENAEDFKAFLIKFYGGKFGFHPVLSMVHAWRTFDKSGDGKLSISEFAEALRKTGFQGSMTTIFKELDSDKSGVLDLAEWDAAAAEEFHRQEAEKAAQLDKDLAAQDKRVAAFLHKEKDPDPLREWAEVKAALVNRFGPRFHFRPDETLAWAWREVFNPRGKPNIQLADFGIGLREGGIQAETRSVFSQLDHSTAGFITLADMDEAAAEFQAAFVEQEAQAAGQKQREVDKMMAFRKSMDVSTRGEIKRSVDTLPAFKQFLIKQFGAKVYFDPLKSLKVAWSSMDTSGDGKLTLREFSQGLQAAGLQGSVPKFFKMLDRQGKGVIGVDDLLALVEPGGVGDIPEGDEQEMQEATPSSLNAAAVVLSEQAVVCDGECDTQDATPE